MKPALNGAYALGLFRTEMIVGTPTIDGLIEVPCGLARHVEVSHAEDNGKCAKNPCPYLQLIPEGQRGGWLGTAALLSFVWFDRMLQSDSGFWRFEQA